MMNRDDIIRMATDRELMQQALEALEKTTANTISQAARIQEAVEALRERLAQPEQEPFEYWNAVEGWVKIDEVRKHFDSVGCGTIYKTAGEDRVPLYTAPPQRKQLTQLTEPEPEPVAWRFRESKSKPWSISDDGYYISCKRTSGYIIEPLYTAPPQRKQLTNEEIGVIWDEHIVPVFGKNGISPIVFARAVIAKATGEKE